MGGRGKGRASARRPVVDARRLTLYSIGIHGMDPRPAAKKPGKSVGPRKLARRLKTPARVAAECHLLRLRGQAVEAEERWNWYIRILEALAV